MKAGLLAGLYAIAALRDVLGGRAARRGSCSWATRTRRSGRRCRRPTSGGWPRRPTPASSSSARARTATSSRRARGTWALVDHGPRARGARRRGAREGPQRDPRGGAPGPGPPRAQRALARGHGERRRDRGRHCGPNVVAERCRSRSTCGRWTGRRSRRPRRRCGRSSEPRVVPGRHGRRRGGRAPLADGEAGAVGAARRRTRSRSRRTSGSSSTTRRPAAPRTPTRRRAWASRRSTASGPIGGMDHSPRGVPRGRARSCPGRRCSPG